MNLNTFDLNLLRVLDALLREGSTVKAGQSIGLSQPAVSAALGRLRAALDDPLFVRQGQGLEATAYARSLDLPVREALDRIEAILAGPDSFVPAAAQASFKISGSDFFAEMLMPGLGERLAREAPGVRVQMVDLVPDNYVGTLAKHEVDLALIPRPEAPKWATFQPLFHSGFHMIARHGHPRLRRAGVKPGDTVPIDLFCDLGHILFSPEGKLQAMGDTALAAVGRERRVVMTMPVFYGVCSAVAGSDNVALIPEQFGRRLAPKLGLEAFCPPMPIAPALIGMIWHRRATENAPHKWLRGVVEDLMTPLNQGYPPVPAAK